MSKSNIFKLSIMFLSLWCTNMVVMAQTYDDLYYDPTRDNDNYYQESYRSENDRPDFQDDYNYGSYDDGDYDDDQYDYYYTSRIKRFHRPYYGFDYFDPVYIDVGYYDPFFTPGVTVLIYDSPFGFSSYNRWRRWNRNRFFYGWNDPFYSPFYGDPFFGPRWNRGWYGRGGFGFNRFGLGYSSFYCPPSWGGGYSYNTYNNVVVNNVEVNGRSSYYGPRSGGSTVISRSRNAQTGVRTTNGQQSDQYLRSRSSNSSNRTLNDQNTTVIQRDGLSTTSQRNKTLNTRDGEYYNSGRLTKPSTRSKANTDYIRNSNQSRTYGNQGSRTYDGNSSELNRSSRSSMYNNQRTTRPSTSNRSIYNNSRTRSNNTGSIYRNQSNSRSRSSIGGSSSTRSRSTINRSTSRSSSGSTMSRSRSSSSSSTVRKRNND